MKISLILATWNRTEEVHRLLESLARQTYRNFEVVMVDQNSDDRLADLVATYRSRFELARVKAPPRGHAAANNVGLPFVTGDIIGFLDDDCWYPRETLSSLVANFLGRPGFGAITGREASSEQEVTNARFDLEAGEVTLWNIWRRHISFTMFFRSAELGDLRFNESLGTGAGTRWGAGEETDYLLRFMEMGHRVYYDPDLVVCHPDWGLGPFTPAYYRKARSYGMGMGRLLRTYRFPAPIILKYLVRPLGGMVLYAVTGRFQRARYYFAMLCGRLGGWILSGRAADV